MTIPISVKLNLKQRLSVALIVALAVQLLVPTLIGNANAGTLTYTMVRMDRMKISTASTGTVCAKPATAGTETTVKVSFPTSYTVNGTAGNWTVSTTATGWPLDPADNTTAATAWPGIGTATLVSGQDVTFASGELTVGTWYCFNWTGATTLTIKGTATANNTGVVTTQATGPSTIDTGNYATSSMADDQITVTATVNASFNFQLSSNTAALGTLTTGAVASSSAINARVDTNAYKGWNIWARDVAATAGTRGLYSTVKAFQIATATNGYTPAAGSAASTLSAGTEGFNLGTGTPTQTAGSGTVTRHANFIGDAATKGGGLDNVLRVLAYSTGTADNSVVPLTFNAAISAITPAATDYQAIVTVVAAGNF